MPSRVSVSAERGLAYWPAMRPMRTTGLLQAVDEHQAHLQQDLQLLRDLVGLAVLEALGAVAALEDEALAALGRGDVLLAAPRFPRTRPAAAGATARRSALRAPRDRDRWPAAAPACSASSPDATDEVGIARHSVSEPSTRSGAKVMRPRDCIPHAVGAIYECGLRLKWPPFFRRSACPRFSFSAPARSARSSPACSPSPARTRCISPT